MEQHYKETLGTKYHAHGDPFPGETKSETKSYVNSLAQKLPRERKVPKMHTKKKQYRNEEWGEAESQIPEEMK